MIERRQDFGFTTKTKRAVGIPGEFGGQNLDRNVAFQLRIARPIDLTIPPLPISAVIS